MSSPGRRASAAAHPKKRVFDVEYDPDEFEELEPDEEAADNNDGEDDSAEEAAVAPIRMSPRLKRYKQARSYLCYVTFLSRSHVPLTSRSFCSRPAHVPPQAARVAVAEAKKARSRLAALEEEAEARGMRAERR